MQAREQPSLEMQPNRSDVDTADCSSLKPVSGVKEVADLYSTFLLDMWGVMHDGTSTYDGVLDTIQQLKKAKKRMIILSNSSKRKSDAIQVLSKLGFDPEEDFEDIITSGEVSYRMLSNDPTLICGPKWDVLEDLIRTGRKKAFVLGSGNGDEEYVESCGWTLVESIREADLIIARGTFTIYEDSSSTDGSGSIISKDEDGGAYDQALQEALKIAAERRVPMLVTNPDKVRPDKDLSPMPGSIADSYEKLLGGNDTGDGDGDGDGGQLVKRIGKPFPEVYNLALGLESGTNTESTSGSAIMVGDALETDVKGGIRADCSTLWVTQDGIHAATVNAEGGDYHEGVKVVIRDFNRQKANIGGENGGVNFVCPTFVTPHFRW